MSKTETTTVADSIDPKTRSKAENGVDASRKVMLCECGAPFHVLDSLGVEVPHRDYNPEDAYEYPTTVELGDTRVHLHQDVREDSEDDFGNFGAIEEDTEDVIWTVVDLTDETVTLTVVGDWSKRRHVPFEDFTDEYEPITCTVPVGTDEWGKMREVPQFGY